MLKNNEKEKDLSDVQSIKLYLDVKVKFACWG